MSKKVFHGRGDVDLIHALLKLSLEERKKEIVHCDLPSLAKMMQSFPSWQVNEIASAMPADVRKEFVRVVKIYKGEIAAPKKKIVVKAVKKKTGMTMPILAVSVLAIVISLINVLAPH